MRQRIILYPISLCIKHVMLGGQPEGHSGGVEVERVAVLVDEIQIARC